MKKNISRAVGHAFGIVSFFGLVFAGVVHAQEKAPQVPSGAAVEPLLVSTSSSEAAAPLLRECVFNLGFDLLPPSASEQKVAWIGLNIFECLEVRSAETVGASSESDIAAGVRPSESTEELWQLRVRQAYIGTNGGDAAKVEGTFSALAQAEENTPLAADESFDWDGKYGPGGIDWYSRSIMNWATEYDPRSHTFKPHGDVFIVKTPSGHWMKLVIEKHMANGGGFELDPNAAPDAKNKYRWNPELGPKDGQLRVVLRTVTNLTAGDRRLGVKSR